MKNKTKTFGLACMLLAFPMLSFSQDGQRIDIEFGHYGYCPAYYMPGTTAFSLCMEEREESNVVRPVRFDRPLDVTSIKEDEEENPFNIQERYD